MKTKTPKDAGEDPAIKSAREREERRADSAFLENAKGVLDEQTRDRIRRFGVRRGAGAVGVRPGVKPGNTPDSRPGLVARQDRPRNGPPVRFDN